MKSVLYTCLLLTALAIVHLGLAQTTINNDNMETDLSMNKEVIRNLYEKIMNNRKFDLFESVVSEDYSNSKGEVGLEAFKKGIMAVVKAFPDAKWTLTEVIAEGNKVFVKQHLQGVHKGTFQNIPPTSRFISNDGMVIYELKNAKIINHEIQTDRLSFLQQLGVAPPDPATLLYDKKTAVYFVDKFIIPESSIEEFMGRMQYNRNFIKTIPGFVKDEVIAREDANGDLIVMTIAVWRNQDYLDKAKQLVDAEYKKINFNPAEFTKRLNIKMEREMYRTFK